MKVSVSEDAVHSGLGGGAVPETFRIANNLLDRIEDPMTKRMENLKLKLKIGLRKKQN